MTNDIERRHWDTLVVCMYLYCNSTQFPLIEMTVYERPPPSSQPSCYISGQAKNTVRTRRPPLTQLSLPLSSSLFPCRKQLSVYRVTFEQVP